jgi:hypothetical protein
MLSGFAGERVYTSDEARMVVGNKRERICSNWTRAGSDGSHYHQTRRIAMEFLDKNLNIWNVTLSVGPAETSVNSNENRWSLTALSSENLDVEADDGDRLRLNRVVVSRQPHPGRALLLVQKDDAVSVDEPDAPQARHDRGDLRGVHPAQDWTPWPVVHVNMKTALAAVEHALHGAPDGLAVDACTGPRVVDGVRIGHRLVGGHQHQP